MAQAAACGATPPASRIASIGVLVRPDGVLAWATDVIEATDIAYLEAALLGAGAIVTPALFRGDCA